MADIQYLNYGDQQIEQQALLNRLADQVQGYVLRQPWSEKRKQKFMSAYADIMNRGIIGASNTTGQWMIEINGIDLNLDQKSKMDQEMYKEAGYDIRLNEPTTALKHMALKLIEEYMNGGCKDKSLWDKFREAWNKYLEAKEIGEV